MRIKVVQGSIIGEVVINTNELLAKGFQWLSSHSNVVEGKVVLTVFLAKEDGAEA